VSADLGGEASTDIKEIAAGVDPRGMSTDQLAGGGRGGAPRPGWPRVRWRWPTGIRNGGLLLVLVAAAALMALVDQPVGPDQGRRPPGSVQHLPPPVGIAQDPPAGAQPPPSAGELATGERPAAAARAHPRRAHPRPDGPGSASGRAVSALTPSGGPAGSGGSASGSGGSGGTGPGGTAPPSPPPVTTAPVQASASVRARVPSVRAGVTPPTVAGRRPRTVEAATPEVSVDLPLSVPPVTLLGG
jgi:hypothetical protein